ncbi:asparagine synthase-related protein [Niveibacterium terrae]|uniref:asparagine synthase-related protein n=1 Tax=Niveibacterium terrae TaxID=3373598 RepID=UPI003A9114A9
MIHSLLISGKAGGGTGHAHIVTGPEWRVGWSLLPESGMVAKVREQGSTVVFACARLGARETLDRECGGADFTDDADRVFAAWDRWGEAAPAHLYGNWCLWVRWQDGRVWMARDANPNLGWFFRELPDGIAVASHLPSLLKLEGLPAPDVDEAILCELMIRVRAQDNRRTFWKGIGAIPVGASLTRTASGTKIRRWWFPEKTPVRADLSRQEHEQRFREVLAQCVEDALPAQGPLAITLSGGLDSGSVAAIAGPQARRRGQALHAYTLVPARQTGSVERPIVNEWDYAAATATQVGTASHRAVSAAVSIVDALARSVRDIGLPEANSNYHWLESMARLASEDGASTLLQGQFGNVTLSWPGLGYFWSALAHGDWRQAASAVCGRAGWRRFVRRQLGHIARPVLAFLRPRRPNPWLESRVALLAPDQRARFEAGLLPVRREEAERDFLPQDANRMRLSVLTGRVGRVWTPIGRAYGVSVLDPTGDRRMVELCYSVPDWVFWNGGKQKGLVRQGMRGRLPDKVLDCPSKAVQGADLCARLMEERGAIQSCIDRFRAVPLVREWIDLEAMQGVLDRLVPDADQWLWAEAQNTLCRGLVFGFFLEYAQQLRDAKRDDRQCDPS